MTPAEFGKLLKQLDHLTDKQHHQLQERLSEEEPVKRIIRELEQRLVEHPECPHCHSRVIKRYGKKGDMQRYRCKNCLKTFTATTNTPLARLRMKEKWGAYLEGMLESKALRKAAHDSEINLKTAFRWRHRFLQLPAQLKAKLLEGIVESDETYFAYSEKGNKRLTRQPRKRGKKTGKRGRSKEDWVPVLTVRDRGTHTFEAILESTSQQAISEQLVGKIEQDSVFCSDGYKSYIQFTQDNGLVHKRLNLSAGVRVIDKVFHVQNVNAYHSRLKQWINRFHGVATKYLDHYLGWFRLMDTSENLNENKLFQLQQHLVGT
jgi:transposase-like protein/IS1 family transposase